MKLVLGLLIVGAVAAWFIWRVKEGGQCGCGSTPSAGLGKKTRTPFDVSCGEIPETLLEEFSRLMQSGLQSMSA